MMANSRESVYYMISINWDNIHGDYILTTLIFAGATKQLVLRVCGPLLVSHCFSDIKTRC